MVAYSMTNNHKYELLRHHQIPRENLSFPKQHLGDANQSFKLQWIEEHGWWLVHSSKPEQTMNKMVSVIGMIIEDSLHVDVHKSP